MIRSRWIARISVVVLSAAGVTLILWGGHAREEGRGSDPATGVTWSFLPAKEAVAQRIHPILCEARGAKDPVTAVRARLRETESAEVTETVPLQPVEGTGLWAGEIAARGSGERVFFTLEIETGPADAPAELRRGGPVLVLPPGAPSEARSYRVRWSTPASPALGTARDVLLAASALLGIHGLFYVVLFLTGAFEKAGARRSTLRAAAFCGLAGASAFLAAAVPVGIAVKAGAVGEGWGGWPLGTDVADTKAQVVLLAWSVLLAWRWDLFRRRGDERPVADRAFALLFLAALSVTLGVLGIPPSHYTGG